MATNGTTLCEPTSDGYRRVRKAAAGLVEYARGYGLIVNIDQTHFKPLTMGNYVSVVRVWPAREEINERPVQSANGHNVV